MEAKQMNGGLAAATETAYRVITAMGYTHARLEKHPQVNYNTLRAIRDKKKRKPVTDEFYLQLFVKLLDKEYTKRMAQGGEGATSLLLLERNIFKTLLGLPAD